MIPDLIQTQQQLGNEMKELRRELSEMKQQPVDHASEAIPQAKTSEPTHAIIETFKELELRRAKECNLVVFGLESSEGTKEKVTGFIKSHIGVDVKTGLTSVCNTRGPKPLLILKFNNKQIRD